MTCNHRPHLFTGKEKNLQKSQISIERIKHFQNNDMPYFVAFSGGKDSIVMYDLFKKSGVSNYTVEYSNTTVDPPDLIYFIRKNYPEVKFRKPKMTMWQLIPKKQMPPTRLVRYCCEALKEDSGNGCIVVTGIRAAESLSRSKRKMFEPCMKKRNKYYLNPIIDWTESDVWEYIIKNKLPYPKLYDYGWKRIGCVGCPMAGKKQRKLELDTYPKIKENYLRAFQKMIDHRIKSGLKTEWKTADQVMGWWLEDKEYGNGQEHFIFMDN